MSASQSIRDRFYGKNRIFTRAVDELDIIGAGASAQIERERRKKIVAENTAEPCKPFEIILERLTALEINAALNGNLSRWGIQKRPRATKKERKIKGPTPRYNLRKRSK